MSQVREDVVAEHILMSSIIGVEQQWKDGLESLTVLPPLEEDIPTLHYDLTLCGLVSR
jgi:hypothetical protein